MNGQLAVSRAFGDKNLKSHLRSDPDVHHFDINSDAEFLILASDGLWKVLHHSNIFLSIVYAALEQFLHHLSCFFISCIALYCR